MSGSGGAKKQVEKAARPSKGKGTGGVGSDDTDSGEDNYAKKVKAGLDEEKEKI